MKTVNSYFTNREDLEKLVKDNGILKSETILVQLFSSILDKSVIEGMIKDILEVLPSAKIIGSTSDGEILNDVVSTLDSVVISITTFDKSSLHVAVVENSGNSFECGEKLASEIIRDDTQAMILFSDGLHTNGEIFLNGIKSITKDVTIAGGMAGDSGTFTDTYIFSNDKILSSGAVGISINSNSLHVKTSYSFNWQGIGKEFKVTKSTENRVYKIEDMTPVEMYAKYLGKEASESLPAIGIEFPLIIKRDGVKIARAILGKEEDGSLIFAGNISTGDIVQFGYGNSDMILQESKHIKDNYVDDKIESIFIYSCMARRRFLQDAISHELMPIAQLAPTCGFFTYGEFFKSSSSCELLNQTMTILAMSENKESSYEKHYNYTSSHSTSNIADSSATHKALSHLINKTSNDLRDTNINLESLVEIKTEELNLKIRELERTSQVKNEFIQSMSHEIKSPLEAMLGFVDILKKGEENKQRLKRFSIIQNSGLGLKKLIDDLFDYSKLDSGNINLHITKFPTIKPFKEVLSQFEEIASKSDIKLELNYENLPRFFANDQEKIDQILLKIVENSIHFTKRGGKVTITLEYIKNALICSVKDSGVGMTQDRVSKLLDTNYQGSGLGLSIAKALIKTIGGELSISSRVGEGSEFKFNILEKEILKESINFKQQLKGRVLVAEDDDAGVMLIKVILNDMGFDVDIAQNGKEATEFFQKHDYVLILMDENMPKMNGTEATKLIREYESSDEVYPTPIVAITANSSLKEKFLVAGMDELIKKPLDHKLFIETIHSFLA